MVKLTDRQKEELFALFPDQAAGLIERSDYDELIDFLGDETVSKFVNDEPTPESDRIEKLMDEINGYYMHPPVERW